MVNERFWAFKVKRERVIPLAENSTFEHFEVAYYMYLTDNIYGNRSPKCINNDMKL